MTEQKDFSPRPEVKKRKPYQIGQIIEQAYRSPKGKIPENSRWTPLRRHPDKNYVEAWQLTSTIPEIPSQEQLLPQKPPEVIREEIKDAQIDDWHKRTDI
jgi:hypothetical protein